MATCYTYDGGRFPILSGHVDTVLNHTNPTETWLVYTNPVAATQLTDDDDNTLTIDSFHPEIRHGKLYVTGGTIRYLTNDGVPTAAIGQLLADGGEKEWENQPAILHKLTFIAASGTPVVYFFPEG